MTLPINCFSCRIILFLSIPIHSSSLRLDLILISIAVTELILNYLYALFPEISYKEQTLLSQQINTGTSALLSPHHPHLSAK